MAQQSEYSTRLFEAYEEVRQSGKCNMFDGTCVVNEMIQLDIPPDVMPLLKIYSSGTIKVDSRKYGAFLKEVGDIMSMADKLTRG